MSIHPQPITHLNRSCVLIQKLQVFSLVVVFLLLSSFAISQSKNDRFYNADANYVNVKDGIAVEGYDVVAYFRSGVPTKGQEQLYQLFDGVTYYFNNEENRKAFTENPEKFIPQFGGYCAFGVGFNIGEGVGDNKPGKYPVNPESFKIVDDKLYLFYRDQYYHALNEWDKDEKKYLTNAVRQWSLMHNHK